MLPFLFMFQTKEHSAQSFIRVNIMHTEMIAMGFKKNMTIY